jgi:hypothetical protein
VTQIFLLIRENIPDALIAAPGHVDSFVASIETDAIHSLDSGEIRDLLVALRIHDKHSRRHTCPDKHDDEEAAILVFEPKP